MRSWRLDRPNLSGHLDLSRATSLVSAIGSNDANAFAAEVLKLLGDAAGISQCTVFAYEFNNRPRTVSVADHRGGRYLSNVADTYAKTFYALDGNQTIISSARPRKPDSAVLLHQQAIEDISHEGYRAACYHQPDVSGRLSLLLQPSQDIWLSVNLYRDRRRGHFHANEIALIEAFAPLIAQTARHHYALCGQIQTGIPQLMLARIRGICPDLSKRELDVLCGVLEGRTAKDIGELMGVKASSVVTYQKRAFRRLGISSQRQLFALCLATSRE
ncbi:LuxR family transcriptional regulator [Caballeronia arvi]|uniref:LuxR family transcriptional regulator n=1 Tax=Caballeronia arvi TaxID=1777135 RepID=A0A158IRN6_9BURK|nr:LuxR C-terminal-related transcriptional regulator [Caballeronia arvi]SAL59195.1 LuxR family transcriptional regulator [Caballeronia arvi]